MHQEMGRAMKQIRKMGGLKGLGALLGGGGMGGGAIPGGPPPGLPGLGGPGGGLPPDLQNFLKKK
jgi:signal recognition particle subunit SRP54